MAFMYQELQVNRAKKEWGWRSKASTWNKKSKIKQDRILKMAFSREAENYRRRKLKIFLKN